MKYIKLSTKEVENTKDFLNYSKNLYSKVKPFAITFIILVCAYTYANCFYKKNPEVIDTFVYLILVSFLIYHVYQYLHSLKSEIDKTKVDLEGGYKIKTQSPIRFIKSRKEKVILENGFEIETIDIRGNRDNNELTSDWKLNDTLFYEYLPSSKYIICAGVKSKASTNSYLPKEVTTEELAELEAFLAKEKKQATYGKVIVIIFFIVFGLHILSFFI